MIDIKKGHPMKFVKQSIAILVLISILVLSSCEYLPFLSDNEQSDVQSNPQGDEFVDGNHPYHYLFPEGYTGGFNHQPGANIEYWWVETYEECVAAIELLKSNDSSFSTNLVLTYDGELFDSKYCFMFIGVGSRTDEIKWGDNPFDRHAENVNIRTFAFFEEVSIDELNHSYITQYNAYEFSNEPQYEKLQDEIDIDACTIDDWYYDTHNYSKKAFYKDQLIFFVKTCFFHDKHELKFTDECIKAILKSGKIIE